MNALEAAQRIGECFDEDKIPYGIGGALALGVWGALRATRDVDINVFVAEAELPRAFDSLERAGVLLDRATATRDLARIGLCRGRLGRIVVDIFVSQHPQHAEMQRRVRRVADAEGHSSAFLSVEDLALHKLIFGRPKDVTDLERLFAVRLDLDVTYVRRWLIQMVPAGDQRLAILDDLEERFIHRR